MEYKYHCQPQAEEFARQIIPVPNDYPLREGLPANYRENFVKFCDLAKALYLDMAVYPEEYGLKLIEISSQNHHEIRAARNKLHRLCDTMLCLANCGALENHRLIISAEQFKNLIKKPRGAVSNPVPKYELILSRLIDFGFEISDFNGKPFGANVEYFTVIYPDFPEMIDTMKIYFDCWADLKNDHKDVIMWNEFHHCFYRLDYKVTADHKKLTAQQWLHDKALRFDYPEDMDKFYIAFHEYSHKFKNLCFDGEYYYKSKRIARDLQVGLGKYRLSLILKDMNKYIEVLEAMPESIKKPFTRNSCNHCGFQGATNEHCKFRRSWTLDGVSYEACAFYGFQFNDFSLERVPEYWRLLELEYNLVKV